MSIFGMMIHCELYFSDRFLNTRQAEKGHPTGDALWRWKKGGRQAVGRKGVIKHGWLGKMAKSWGNTRKISITGGL